jgi:uncharacterized protein YcbX
VPSLARINVTPVKGTALHHVSNATLTEVGIQENRRFHLADDRGRLCSGVAFGPLVQVVADLDGTMLTCRFPDGSTVTGSTESLGVAVHTDFFGRNVAGHVVEGPLTEAFSEYVGTQVCLVRADRDGDGPDVLPLTLVTYASVRELGSRGGYPGDLNPLRFRINLELDGSTPFEEDSWDGGLVRCGEAVLRIAGQIPRSRLPAPSRSATRSVRSRRRPLPWSNRFQRVVDERSGTGAVAPPLGCPGTDEHLSSCPRRLARRRGVAARRVRPISGGAGDARPGPHPRAGGARDA